MAIIKRAKPVSADTATGKEIDRVIEAAPDGTKVVKGVHQGNKRQITIGFDPDFLDQVDARRALMGLSRPAFITLACQHLMEKGIVIGGRDEK